MPTSPRHRDLSDIALGHQARRFATVARSRDVEIYSRLIDCAENESPDCQLQIYRLEAWIRQRDSEIWRKWDTGDGRRLRKRMNVPSTDIKRNRRTRDSTNERLLRT